MKLIADSGGTKIDWCLIDGLEEVRRLKTPGFNAATTPREEIARRLRDDILANFPEFQQIKEVYFYGSGCIGNAAEDVKIALAEIFTDATVEVNSDLLGAARGMCGKGKGIVCILGTGSNTGLYDGREIVQNIPALGYILGDEGSGAVLGKLLIGDVFKEQLPQTLREKFFAKYQLTIPQLLENVYRKPEANRYLASFTPFLLENIEEPAIHRMVLNNFKSFFVRNITHYPEFRNMRINITGSIGWYFRDVLKEAAEAMDCTLGKICVSPLEGLVEYHVTD